jgi:pSer/pThr/pTyr-binding forkhead associated (FHA) protein
MLQLRVLSGKTAGTSWVSRRFPVRIGRSPSAHLRLEENGVWDEHLQLHIDSLEGFVLESSPEALTTVNGLPLQRAVLKSGDVIEIGSVKIQFSLSETRQASLRLREALTWVAIASISLGQVGLVYWLLK